MKVGQVVKGIFFSHSFFHLMHFFLQIMEGFPQLSGCAYYAAWDMADNAQLVFCPYNYIINPIIQGAMELDIKGAILILD